MGRSEPSDPSPDDETMARLFAHLDEQGRAGRPPSFEPWLSEHPHLADWVAEHRSMILEVAALGRSGAAQGTSNENDLPEPAPPDEFELVEMLGSGATGTVWLARHRDLKRNVALKLFHPWRVEGDEARSRFLAEAQAAARIDDPSVARIHWAKLQGPQPWLCLELAEGSTLHLPSAGEPPVPIDRALLIARDLAHGLRAIHAADLVHRDLKASNVMVDRLGRAKIVDLSVAITAHGGTAPDPCVMFEGTVRCMAPEQLDGLPLDGRTDLFALGLLLYELLSGRPPFADSSIDERRDSLRKKRPPKLRTLRPEIPPDLEALIDSLLEPEPSKRPPSAAVVEAELGRILDQVLRSLEPGWKRTLRHPAVVAAGLLLAAVAGALVLKSRLNDRGILHDEHAAAAVSTPVHWKVDLVKIPEGKEPAADGGGERTVVGEGSRVVIGDRLQLQIECDGPIHVYAWNEALGEQCALFPISTSPYHNPLQPGAPLLLPSVMSYWTQSPPAGMQTVAVFFSREPDRSLEAALAQMRQPVLRDGPNHLTASAGQRDPVESTIGRQRTRGFGVIEEDGEAARREIEAKLRQDGAVLWLRKFELVKRER